MGILIPKGIKVRIVEDDPTTVTFVIQHSPEQATSMEEDELRKIAGAGGRPTYHVIHNPDTTERTERC
jgi:hypothetical protein